MCYFKSYLPGEISKHFLKCKGYCFNSSQCSVAAKFLRWNCPFWPHDKVALGFFPPWNVKNLNCYLKKKTRKNLRVLMIMIRPCRILIRFWVGSTIWKMQCSPNWLIHILSHVNKITKLFLFLLLILYSFVNKKIREIDLYLISRVFSA